MPPHDHPGLDLEAATKWLSTRVGLDGALTATQVAGGRSNLTYVLVDATNRLVLRRPPLGDLLRGAHDVAREYRIVDALQGTAVPVPRAIALCEEPEIIGAPFSVVTFVDGLTLRTPGDVNELSAGGRGALTSNFARTLAELHAIPPERAGLPPEKGVDFAARQLYVWQRQLEAVPVRSLPTMDELGHRLSASVPSQRQVSIVHGDYRLDNVLFNREGETRALLDWELWTLGDPLADLGAATAYWTDSTYQLAPLGTAPTILRQLGTREDFVAAYEAAGGLPVDEKQLAWYASFGMWRFAAILEGVYRRNLAGAYGDRPNGNGWERYSFVVPALAEVALQHLLRS